MEDWLFTATETQAKLEDALTKLQTATDELNRHRHTLGIIAHDGHELSHDKIREQRDRFIRLAWESLHPEVAR